MVKDRNMGREYRNVHDLFWQIRLEAFESRKKIAWAAMMTILLYTSLWNIMAHILKALGFIS